MTADLASKKAVFGKYDIRGAYPDELDEELVASITSFLAENLFAAGKVVVGHDARHSSPSLHETILKALKSYTDIEVVEAGLITTPMLYFLVNNEKAKGGIMVTASHNSANENGLKVVGEGAVMLGGEEIYKLIND